MSKRIRHVMDADEVAHTWANPRSENDDARVPHGNFYFQGETIYSYGSHFQIARHVKNEHGKPAVLFTTNTYGPTTGRHLNITRRACRHLTVFEVPSLGDRYGAAHHSLNMQHFQKVYDGIIERAERCNVNSYSGINDHIQAAQDAVQQGADYAAFFDLDDCVVPAWQSHLDWLVARYKRLRSPEAEAKREAGREKRLAYEIKRNAEKIERWRAGDTRVNFGYGSSVPCMLRIRHGAVNGVPNRTIGEIETSWGAWFPVEDATRAFRFISIIRKRGECYKPNGEQAPTLGNYHIDRIAADGTVRAGCHTVAWSEIEGIARQLGLVS